MSPTQHLVSSILLFFRNATKENRVNKNHFTKREDFLPCLLGYLNTPNQHPKLRAYSAGLLWSLVHGHQGIKAAINKPAVVNDLQVLKSESQREADKRRYRQVATIAKENDLNANFEFHGTYQLGSKAKQQEQEQAMSDDMHAFTC